MRATVVLACALLIAGCGKKPDAPKDSASVTPSRSASDGCEWTKFEAKGAGVSMLVEKCREPRFTFEDDGSGVTLTRISDGSKTRVIEIQAKGELQPTEAAIREQFVSALPDKERAGCVVAPSTKAHVEGVAALAIQPGGEYVKEVAQQRGQNPALLPCGEFGESAGIAYFLSQPDVTRTRFAFIHAAQPGGPFDELSVRLLPDDAAAAALASMPVTSLVAAQRLAASVEARMDKLQKKSGQFVTGGMNSTWTAFLDSGNVALIVETQDAGESGSGSLRYFFRDGKLFFLRDNSLGAATKQTKGTQAPIVRTLAFGPGGELVGARKVVSGKAEKLEDAEAKAAGARAADLLKRVQSAK